MYSLSLQLNKKTALIYILIRKEFTHSLKDWWTYRQSYLSSLETLLVRITGTLLQIYKFGIYKWPPTAITADQDNLGRCSEQASLRYATLACELFWAEGNGDLACSRETILFYFFILEGGEKERGRETGTDVRETYQLAVFCIHPNWEPNLQPRHVPWPGIKPIIFEFVGWYQPGHTSQAQEKLSLLP